ncbi:Protein OS-9 -like protein [Capsicum baccatum]|uniref:Protein OS-9 homolog n=1 Tax=Capsicum baccatum TaxID=33114 RepID=A0A2G2WB14_CAPBA|nr:Protein OS-9 -like protein [Capsicum baccatum]
MRSILYLIVVFVSINNIFLYDVVSSSQIISVYAGTSLSQSSKEPKYKVEFHSEDAPFQPDDDQETILMPNKNGEKFLCYLPKVDKPKIGKSVTPNISSLVVDTEKHIKLKTPDEVLEVLKDRCLTRLEGWWSYEFCYENKLRQVHLEDEKPVQEFVLGYYDAEATAAYHQSHSDKSVLKDPRSKDASQRYHAHIYTNGTVCDLTNEPRQTEVRFVCSEPRALISSITELSTCKYALTVHCPTLCKHPLFQEERPVWHTINCNKLPKDYRETKAEENFNDEKIAMVTDSEDQPSIDSDNADEHANVEGDNLEDENITVAT